MVQVRMAYGGYICNGCGRVCGFVNRDARCDDCGPLPKERVELTPHEQHLAALAREREFARRIRLED
jgi:hypothetical protein